MSDRMSRKELDRLLKLASIHSPNRVGGCLCVSCAEVTKTAPRLIALRAENERLTTEIKHLRAESNADMVKFGFIGEGYRLELESLRKLAGELARMLADQWCACTDDNHAVGEETNCPVCRPARELLSRPEVRALLGEQ